MSNFSIIDLMVISLPEVWRIEKLFQTRQATKTNSLPALVIWIINTLQLFINSLEKHFFLHISLSLFYQFQNNFFTES